ncbi:protein of unknown function [Cyanobium sp. NIES-981]|nr:protein of unknown function [Cyanobium sp. NIES-981]
MGGFFSELLTIPSSTIQMRPEN